MIVFLSGATMASLREHGSLREPWPKCDDLRRALQTAAHDSHPMRCGNGFRFALRLEIAQASALATYLALDASITFANSRRGWTRNRELRARARNYLRDADRIRAQLSNR